VGKGVIDEVLGIGFDVLRRVAPQCSFCGEASVFLCANCGRNACHIHSFINAQRPNDLRTYKGVCVACMAENFDFVRVSAADSGPRTEDWPHKHKPWEVLGIPWYSKEEDINNAYKARARECHPDHGGDEVEMKKVSAAKEYMMQQARKFGGHR
jgi:hypothetical protein